MGSGSWWRPEMAARSLVIILVLAGMLAGCASLKLNPYSLETRVVQLPFNMPVSFDDFIYDSHLHRVIIPAGKTGQVALIDPTNFQVQLIPGFSQKVDSADPVVGTSAVAVAGGFLFGLDQATHTIKTIDLGTDNVVGSIPLQAAPEYIRYISATGELWVTEKKINQIEVFSVSEDNPPTLQSTGKISVPNGPESLIIDDARGLAFTNRPNQSLTDVIQVMTHSVIAQWGNGCSSARGMAIDENEGYLFVACEEGKLVVMDINNDGYQITSQNYGGELKFVAYNPKLHHVYLPSSASGLVAIFQLQTLSVTPEPTDTQLPGKTPPVSPTTTPGVMPAPEIKTSLLLSGTADTDVKAKCVTTDEYDNIWVCDPNNGQVFVIHDAFPDSSIKP
jgi:DNA-binding beta-propeller fold protein YncE